jgi:E3 ubiquitin-protein ligase RNF5
VPPRPQGQRTEPDPAQGFQGFQSFGGGDGGFHLSFGIGAFPFGFFASSFNFNDMRPAARNAQTQQGTPQYEEDQFLSKVFLWVALLFFSWLILA